MRNRIGSYLIVGCISAALGWLAHPTPEHRDERFSADLTDDTQAGSKPMPPSGHQDSPSSIKVEADVSPTYSSARTTGASYSSADDGTSVSAEKNDSTPFVLLPDHSGDALARASNQQPASTGGVSPDKSALANLLNALTIRCQFDPGNGAKWQSGKIALYNLAYQGGPIVYDSLNIESGTARMIGSSGATGSRTGTLDVLVTATSTGLHFSGFSNVRELIVTTVFDSLDQRGLYLAVKTTHGMLSFNGSYQTYGACDIALSKSP